MDCGTSRAPAVGFPRIFYLRYHGYAKFFPVWAMARYRNLEDQQRTGGQLRPVDRPWRLHWFYTESICEITIASGVALKEPVDQRNMASQYLVQLTIGETARPLAKPCRMWPWVTIAT